MGSTDVVPRAVNRYIAYDQRLGGRYRYYRDPELLSSEFGTRYIADMDRMFDARTRR